MRSQNSTYSLWFLVVALLFVLSLILWSYRWIFFYRFDYAIATNRVNLSQWRIPQSTRIIADDQLYPYAGYELILGKKFILLNAEVPPFAKGLYGLSIQLTQNPYLLSLLLLLTSLGVLFFVARTLGFSRRLSLFATLVLLSNQLFFSQLGQTMLDLTQMLLLLLNLLFLLRATKRPTSLKIGGLLLSGLALGLLAASKFPLFAVIIFIVELLWLLFQCKSWRVLVYVGGVVGAYCLSYAVLLLGDSTLRELISVQAWMIHFYRIGKIEADPLHTLMQLVTGDFYRRTMLSHIQMYSNEWSIWWTTSLVSIVYCTFNKRTSRQQRLLAIVGLLLVLAMIVSPFVNRYFLLVLPLGILLSLSLIQKIVHHTWRYTAYATVFAISLVQAGLFLVAEPYSKLQFAVESWNNANYQDFYQYLQPTVASSQQQFAEQLQAIDRAHFVQKRTMSFVDPTLGQLLQSQFPLRISNSVTQVSGDTLTTQDVVAVSNDHGRLRLAWHARLLADLKSPTCGVESVQDSTKHYFLDIDVSQWELESLLNQLGPLINKSGTELRNSFVVVQANQNPVRVYLDTVPTEQQVTALEQLPGVRVSVVGNQEVQNSLCI